VLAHVGLSFAELGVVKPGKGIFSALIFLAACATAATAQETMSEKLSAGHLGGIEPGSYVAADSLHFTIEPVGDKYLFRIGDQPEVFVLYTDHAALGSRVLKYDTGSTALQVSGWGGLTLYPDGDPTGLPAVREGDSEPPTLLNVSLPEIQAAAQDEGQHLAYSRQLNIVFSADWDKLNEDANARALAFDAMQNVARGLDRFSTRADARNALVQHVGAVKIAVARKPSIILNQKTLVVSIDPDLGYSGRSSSRAVARALSRLLNVKQAAAN
jgi:uncharacterized protein DUF4908